MEGRKEGKGRKGKWGEGSSFLWGDVRRKSKSKEKWMDGCSFLPNPPNPFSPEGGGKVEGMSKDNLQ